MALEHDPFTKKSARIVSWKGRRHLQCQVLARSHVVGPHEELPELRVIVLLILLLGLDLLIESDLGNQEQWLQGFLDKLRRVLLEQSAQTIG